MTVRSAPARRLPEPPKVSFVFPVHDPEYGGGLLARTQRHIDALIDLANRYSLLSEIIIVEWNPRQDRAPFRESLRWPDDLGHVCLRFLEVPAEIHRTLPNADRIPIFEYIAKNAGLRRARGQFLLATNPDLFYSPALIRWLARASLSAEKFYRVDRRDVSEEIPDLSLPRQLRFCSQHVADVHALVGSYRLKDVESGQRLRDEYDRRSQDPTSASRWTTPHARPIVPADGLHRNAAGDFFLMERGWWHRLRGYPELYTHAHIDAILCWVASSAGLVQEILPSRCHLYHQAHHRESRVDFPQTDWRAWYARYQETLRQQPLREGTPMVVNLPDWGLAHEALREWHAGPELTEVQDFGAELDAEARPSRRERDAENAQRILKRVLADAERSLTTTRSELRRTQAALEAARQKQGLQRAELPEPRPTREARRAPAEATLPTAPGAQSSPPDVPASKTADAPPTLRQVLLKRFRGLEPLRVFNVPGDAPRVSVVTESISANNLLSGVSTALVVAAVCARHLGARLRLITLTEPPEPGNMAAVLAAHRILWTGDIEFTYVGPRHRDEVAVGDHEVFLTTSWSSTRCVLPIVDPVRLVYLVQEDERLSYAWGDDRLRCAETLSNPDIQFVINGRGLFDHLTQGPDALPNILERGIWFEPAVPPFERKIAEVDPVERTRHFFFYARPDVPRNLHWRGLEAIGAALEENVLDPAEWTIHMGGSDTIRVELPRAVRPNIVQNLPWTDYLQLVGRMDVALWLNDAPYPSDPLLDFAASDTVVVTNQHGSSSSPESLGQKIIRVESSIEGLRLGIADAVGRAADRNRRQADVDGGHINRDWDVALAPVLARLNPNHRPG